MNENRCKILRGLRFENEVFDLLKRNNIPFVTKKRYTVQLRNGPIMIEPDITLMSDQNLWLISIKTLCRERWKLDVAYEKIPNLKKIIMVTRDVKYSRQMLKLYDHVFVFPQDKSKFIDLVQQKINQTLSEFWNHRMSQSQCKDDVEMGEAGALVSPRSGKHLVSFM